MKSKIILGCLAIATSISTGSLRAQTVPPSVRTPQADNTLNTQVSGTNQDSIITGGLSRGQTLFHSFTDFSIPTGGSANFRNPAGTRDIITRVTGGLFSDINGTLNSGGANFLLINPNGVIFGPNARLNVGRAFAASTANGVDLIDGQGQRYTFGTNGVGDTPLLTINPNVLFNISRLNFGASVTGSSGIINYGTLQTSNPNQYIGLIGGNVSFNGGRILAPGAKVELGGLSQAGSVGFSFDNGVQFPTNVERGNVSLGSSGTSPSIIDVRAGGGGSVGIFAKDITMQGTGTSIRAGIATGLGSPTAQAGDIKLDATGDVILSGAVDIFNRVNIRGVGNGGNIEINTRNLAVTDGAQLQAGTLGRGNAGSIKITATNNVSFDGRKDNSSSAASSEVEQRGVGKGGNIEINTRNLSVTNGAALTASTSGRGDAGSVKITATGSVSFDGRKDDSSSAVLSRVERTGVGKGGNIEIKASNVSVTNGAQLTASTFGRGDAGSVKITAADNVSFDGRKDDSSTVAASRVERTGVGKGGNIEINTRNLAVTNGAQLTASTFGRGDAGSVKITAADNVSFDGSKDGSNSVASSRVERTGVGKGGNIEINTRNLAVTDGAQLTASTFGRGDAGDIFLNANTIKLDRGGILSTSNSSTGGDVNITTKEYLLLRNSGFITTNSASTNQNGNGGNLTINSPVIVATPGNNDITANAVQGSGGRVQITSQGIFGIKYRPNRLDASPFTSDITASSTFGQSGVVDIKTPGTDPGKDSTELPRITTDASNQISQVCSANNRENKFTVTGRGGLPPNASDPLTSDVVWQDARGASSQPAVSSSTPTQLAPPAVGWVLDGKGKVTLVAAGVESQPIETSVVCPNVVGR